MNYPDDINTYLMDRSQASKRLRYSEVEELKLIDEIIPKLVGIMRWSDDTTRAEDALASLQLRKMEIED